MVKANSWIVILVSLIIGFAVGSYDFGAQETSQKFIQTATNTVSDNGVMSASADGLAIWQFPDKRALDPDLFGTPQNPLLTDLLPLDKRDTNEDGTAFTTITNPSMFSNVIKKTSGSIKISVTDLTIKDGPGSKDTAKLEADFKGPNGEDFRVVLKKLNSTGGGHQMLGGVGTNVLMHGATGIGSPLVAEEFSYITLWGVGDFYKDGELVDQQRIIHMMVSERTRDDDFKVGFGVAKPDELEIHLAMPPKKGSPTGPIDSPLPTGVILPNGAEQPFIHTNFYGNIKLTGNQFVQ